ncbi:MAG: hypothetical protein COB36_14820 [Alphaproteobacteria bacterium]|nr:MAG: hypothetical protein COB36_14820 [Alphaproteobacteria bacterium]
MTRPFNWPAGTPIVDANGAPTPAFYRWMNGVVSIGGGQGKDKVAETEKAVVAVKETAEELDAALVTVNEAVELTNENVAVVNQAVSEVNTALGGAIDIKNKLDDFELRIGALEP